ncbi:MAG TPA: 2-dehydropantoate 2-reductase [Burkholderiaceae bacterium]
MTAAGGPILVMGAGSIGCFLGGMLAAAGLEVHFVARPRVLTDLQSAGLRVSDLEGRDHRIEPAALHLHPAPPPGITPALTLLCVKSGATAEAAAQLGAVLPAGSVVISMQNGVGHAERAHAVAPGLTVLPGMVPFNVAELAPGHFHRGTGGALATQAHAALDAVAQAFETQGLKLKQHANLAAVQWGKLLINLNNPVNALSGRPLREELMQRGYRRCFAALQAEGLEVLAAAGITPAQVLALPPQKFIKVLRLPTFALRLIARKMLDIDPKARSSMADDLSLGRKTEIDALCGALVELARKHGLSAPLNERMQALVHACEQRPRSYSPAELIKALQR